MYKKDKRMPFLKKISAAILLLNAGFFSSLALAEVSVDVEEQKLNKNVRQEQINKEVAESGSESDVAGVVFSNGNAQSGGKIRQQVGGDFAIEDGGKKRATAGKNKKENYSFQFSEVPIIDVAQMVFEKTQQLITVDSKVRSTLISWVALDVPNKMALIEQFSYALRGHGLALVSIKGKWHVVAEGDAKLYALVETSSPTGVQTKMFTLSHLTITDALSAVKNYLSPVHSATGILSNRSLLITDHVETLKQVEQLLKKLDRPANSFVERVELEHVSISYLLPMLDQLLTLEQVNLNSGSKIQVLPDVRTNSLVFRTTSKEKLTIVLDFIKTIDTPSKTRHGPNGSIFVLPLRNAQAEFLAPLLANLFNPTSNTNLGTKLTAAIPVANNQSTSSGQRSTSSVASSNAGSGKSADTSTAIPSGSRIQADLATNSLIIQASEPEFNQIKSVVDQLDARRAQVFVESLIVEVNSDKAAEFGIQWQTPWGQKGDSIIGVLGTNFSDGGKNIIDLALGAASGATLPAPGFNLGLGKRQANGTYILGALARFLEEKGAANVLSTPTLLTLDNEEAKIIIGQNVPFITGQFTNTGANSGSVNPFQTIERKDVGLSLRVRPQISEQGTVRMQIFQEVSSVAPGSINSPSGIITNKRSIESNVLVEDGKVIVLGGLMQEEFSETVQQIPGVSDIPMVGNLFKNQIRDKKKTNLMIFLRPMIVRTAEQSIDYSAQQYERFRNLQLVSQPSESFITRVNSAPILPEGSSK